MALRRTPDSLAANDAVIASRVQRTGVAEFDVSLWWLWRRRVVGWTPVALGILTLIAVEVVGYRESVLLVSLLVRYAIAVGVVLLVAGALYVLFGVMSSAMPPRSVRIDETGVTIPLGVMATPVSIRWSDVEEWVCSRSPLGVGSAAILLRAGALGMDRLIITELLFVNRCDYARFNDSAAKWMACVRHVSEEAGALSVGERGVELQPAEGPALHHVWFACPWVTYGLGVVTALVLLVQLGLGLGHVEGLLATVEWGGVRGGSWWDGGWGENESYRLVVAPFLHVSVWHWFGNMVGLVLLGTWLERVLGSRRCLVVAAAGVIGGGLSASVLSPYDFVAGVSGVLAAFLGAALAIQFVRLPGDPLASATKGRTLRHGSAMPVVLERYGRVPFREIVALALMLIVVQSIYLAMGYSIDHHTHAGGFISGVAAVFLLRVVSGSQRQSR